MSKYCVVRTCKARAALTVITGEKITIHKFPQQEYLRQKWELFVNYANRTTDFVSKNHLVCSRHFEPSCYFYTRLRNNAVPTIADKFTVEVALQYRLIPDHNYTRDLDALNDYSNTFIRLRNCETTNDSILRERRAFPQEAPADKPTETEKRLLYGINDVKPTAFESSPVESKFSAIPDVPVIDSMDFHQETIFVESGCYGVEPVTVKTELIEESDNDSCTLPSLIAITPKSHNASSSTSSFKSRIATHESHNETRVLHMSRPRDKLKRTGYCGDLIPSDFSSPRRCKNNLDKLKTELLTTKNRLRVANQKIRRAELKIQTLQSLLSKINDEVSLSAEDAKLLKSCGISTRSKVKSSKNVGSQINAFGGTPP